MCVGGGEGRCVGVWRGSGTDMGGRGGVGRKGRAVRGIEGGAVCRSLEGQWQGYGREGKGEQGRGGVGD